jgi:hypothetical protein
MFKSYKFLITMILFLFVFLIVYVTRSYINQEKKDSLQKEGFTPKIREMYRPYMRNTRIAYEISKDNALNKLNRFFRNIGLI